MSRPPAHPLVSTAVISSTEMMERFSFYGMRALLALYLVAGVAVAGLPGPGLGMSKADANAVYGSYLALVYLTPLAGGWIADRIVGARRAVLFGGIVIAAGHFMMAIPAVWGFWVGLLVIALGTGLLKPNISAMVGDVYRDDTARRDAGFSILYMGINLGAFFAPIVTGAVASAAGWHWAFLTAGFAMCAALLVYAAGWRTLSGVGDAPADPLPLREAVRPVALAFAAVLAFCLAVLAHGLLTGSLGPALVARDLTIAIVAVAVVMLTRLLRTRGLQPLERTRLRGFLFVFASAVVFYLIFDQSGSVLNLFADEYTVRTLGSVDIPASTLQSVNPLLIIIFSPLFAILWSKLGTRIPSVPFRFAFALLGVGLSFWLMILPGLSADRGTDSALWWILGVYVLQTWAELLLSPVGLSASTHLAPPGMSGQVVALWFLAVSVGDALGGQVASLTDTLGYGQYFAVLGALAVAASVVAFLLVPRMKRLMA